MKRDVTRQGDNDLELIVFNDENLYNQMHDPGFFPMIKEMFIYEEEQLDVLKDAVSDDWEENHEPMDEDEAESRTNDLYHGRDPMDLVKYEIENKE